MKKRMVFFIALFAMSAFINAASVSESSSGSVSQEMIASNADVSTLAGASTLADWNSCQNYCYQNYVNCYNACGGNSACIGNCYTWFQSCWFYCPQ